MPREEGNEEKTARLGASSPTRRRRGEGVRKGRAKWAGLGRAGASLGFTAEEKSVVQASREHPRLLVAALAGALDPRQARGALECQRGAQSQRRPRRPAPGGRLFHPFPLPGIDLRPRSDPGLPPAARASTFQTRPPAPAALRPPQRFATARGRCGALPAALSR